MKQVSNFIVLILSFTILHSVSAQKKPINLESIEDWEMFTGRRLSSDGQWVSFETSPANTSKRVLQLKNMITKDQYVFNGGYNGRFSSDSKSFSFLQPAKGNGVPDTTVVITLATGQLEKLAGVNTFAWADSTSTVRSWLSGAKDQQQLTVNTVAGETLHSIKGVLRYVLLGHGEGLIYAVKDSSGTQVVFTDFGKKCSDTIVRNVSSIGLFSWDAAGSRMAFPVTEATKTKLALYELGKKQLRYLPIENNSTDTGYVITEQTRVQFVKDRELLFYSTQYKYPERMQSLSGAARVEVWSTSDSQLYTKQKGELQHTLTKSFYFSYDLVSGKGVQLTNILEDEWQLPELGTSDYILVSTAVPYLRQRQWDPVFRRDAYVVNRQTGERRVVALNTAAEFKLSPHGQYVVWFDRDQQHHYSYAVESGTVRRIDKGITDLVSDTSPGMPQRPDPFGIALWEEQDRSLLIHTDRGVWKVSPTGQFAAQEITAAHRKEDLQFKFYANWSLASTFTSGDTLLFQATAYSNKNTGFFAITAGAKPTTRRLLFGKYSFVYPGMDIAKQGRQILFSFGNTDFYGLFYTKDLQRFDTLHVLNPERTEYNWYKTELVRWSVRKGVSTEGYLIKPENFDPKKKYPMIIWLYENGHARGVNSYILQEWSYSFINFGFYASNGYVVFVPDIQYQTGRPGESGYETVMSGVRYLQKQGWLDTSRMGLQGHSWGGYHVAYMATRTNLFKAVAAGAVVSNMTSAYGATRANYNGESRQWVYEKHQSRLGASLWQRPDLYIQNSPLFRADKITTPLLLVHNGQDGGVPIAQGIEFFSALRRLNKKAWLISYPEENHVLRNPVNKKDFTYRMFQFFEHYLKEKPAPAWMERGVPAIAEGYTKGY